jgi:dTDP-4-amino-4,6-dideoxygalactose transaminase
MIGFNFRMGELEAAIGLEQYKKLKKILSSRSKLLNILTGKLKKLKGLTLPPLEKAYKNNFYTYPFVLNLKEIKISRTKLITFLQKEGLREIGGGYENLHLLPALQKKIAFGDKNFPWSYNKSKISYKKGICPIAEKLHEKNFCFIEVCMFEINSRTIDSIANSFIKVWKRLKLL